MTFILIMDLRSIRQMKDLAGKKVLLRVDFNVPLENGRVRDAFKMDKSLLTIKFLLAKKAKIIIVSHLGRPKKKEKKYSLLPVAKKLQLMLKTKVELLTLAQLKKKKVLEGVVMLENVRFLPGEEINETATAKELAGLADVFVFDGFAVAHRKAASTTGVAKYLPSYAGLLLEEELLILSKVMKKPKHPLVLILGGVKVDTKIPVLKNLLPKADFVLIGGGFANTYFWAKGCAVGGSLVSKDYKKEILQCCANKKVIFPIDIVVGDKQGKEARVVELGERFRLSNKEAIYDIGPNTVKLFSKYIKMAQTLIWNGAMGKFETHPYEYGTKALAHLFAARSRGRAFGVAGGGETVEILREQKLINDVDFVSTGGGAMLEFLSGKSLPGIKVLTSWKLLK